MKLYECIRGSLYGIRYVNHIAIDDSDDIFAMARKIIVPRKNRLQYRPSVYSSNKRMMCFKETAMIHSAIVQMTMLRE